MTAPITPDTPFTPVTELIRLHAQQRPDALALCDETQRLNFAALDAALDRVAASLQRDGLNPHDTIAVCARNSVQYALVFLGALRAGVTVAPIAPSVTDDSFRSMLADANAKRLFIDDSALELAHGTPLHDGCVGLNDCTEGIRFNAWLAPEGSRPETVGIEPDWPFNIIYSSGTTGVPKGIVQSHAMRWSHVKRGLHYGYYPGMRVLLATPLYSNTTLIMFFPPLAFGGCVHLMGKFDARRYLEIAQAEQISHTILVPVQYQRLMDFPAFGEFDLSSFKLKFCTSAPFSPELKAQVLERWPGGLIELYGMTEGGGSFVLVAHEFPHKLHTVGRPVEGHDVRIINEDGQELGHGEIGEVVGHSTGMMTGYHNQPEKTREAEWFDAQGKRFIRTGDIGRFDEDGFLTLLDRRKDMIISGGFNIYPSDLEAQLRTHPGVAEVAVVGMPSRAWGETPVAYVVPRPETTAQPHELMAWYNEKAGKTQRLAALTFVDELPRSAIGKVLKRELREQHPLHVD